MTTSSGMSVKLVELVRQGDGMGGCKGKDVRSEGMMKVKEIRCGICNFFIQ